MLDDGSLFAGSGPIVVCVRQKGGREETGNGKMPTDLPQGEAPYRLDRPRCAEDWRAYDGIRRQVFNLPRPDDAVDPRCHPLLLWLEDQPIGAIQVEDLRNAAAALRLVAIDPAWQARGHGRALLDHAERFARDLGCSKAVVYATPEAAGFYANAGYDEEDWDGCSLGGIVQMLKKLA
jgi:GNAT superfamily N-acetyltransferase